MPLTETPPESVQKALQTITLPPLSNGNGHVNGNGSEANGQNAATEPRLSLAADLTADGKFGERWFIVDQTHARVLTPHGTKSAHVDLEIPLTDIKDARTDTLVGNGALILVLRDGRAIEAVRFTVGEAPVFAAAARALQAYLIDEEPPASLTQGLKKRVCPTCGDPLPEDTDVCPKCVDKKAVLTRLFGYALPYRKQALLFTTLMLLGPVIAVLPPIFQQRLTDDVLVPHKNASWIPWIVFGLIGVSGFSLLLQVWRGRLAAWMSNHMIYSIRTEAYQKLQELSLGYYDKRQTGSLMTRVTQDVNELQNFLIDGIQLFLVNTLTIIFSLAILLYYNWELTLLILIPLPLTVYLTRRIWKMLWGKLHRLWYLRSNLGGSINAALSGVRVVKAFGQENRETQKFKDKAHRLFTAGIVVEQSWATYFPIIGFITNLGTFIIWYVGGLQVIANTSNLHSHGMTLGTLMMFLSYTMMLMQPLQGMTRIADWLSRATAGAERVFEVIDATPEVATAPDAIAMPHIEGRVELQDIRFSYDKNQNVLQDVTLTVEPGEMIGLVGHSGAGKTTIINLISRFYDVQEGAILIDGVDIRKIRPEDLRRQIGVVLQEPFLFPGTISENIAYARPGANPIEIMQAAKAANAHDFIMRQPDGYDTYVGERGARLSGGERQRLSIARAILHNPRILILDEATASVDTETEKQIQEAIGRLIKGRTTFAIAHRLSTLRNASRLMVMERGKLIELGTHDELLANPEGVFRRLVDMQQEVNKLHVV